MIVEPSDEGGTMPSAPGRFYLRQLLAGRDFARGDPTAAGMANFAYLLGDRLAGEAVVVDPAWDVAGILAAAAADGMTIVGGLATHHHPDHVGGSLMGYRVEGLVELWDHLDVPVHAQRAEVASIRRMTGATGEVVGHDGGAVVEVGGLAVTLLHTPGHTPGSQCFLVEGVLVSGDTLFLDGCGRTDLPGGDPEAMYHSLRRLASLPDGTAVLPGHRYSPASAATLEAVRQANVVFRPGSLEDWLTMFS